MIIVRLRGGLGNQMFQYALGRHLSIKNNTELALDDSCLSEPGIASPREYELGVFNVKSELATEKDLKEFNKSKLYNKLNKLFQFNKNIVSETSFNFNPNILLTKDGVLIDGYWQSEKYFKDINGPLLEDFQLKESLSGRNEEILDRIKKSNSISVHIRRGDYANDKETKLHHGLCSIDYYLKAVELIVSKIDNPVFFVFSDDIEWAKENLKMKNEKYFIEGNKGFEDMELMKNCKHNIIANSSFSWWAAWINQNKDKIVIAPEKWLNNPKYNTKDIVPETWIKM